jgi:putative oxidoreductase
MNMTQRLKALAAGLLQPSFTPSYLSQLGWTTLRVVAGLVMIHNGLDKLADIPSFADAYVRVIGLPFPIFFSYCAAYTELIAAPLLALGLFARPAAFGLFGTMSVAMYHHVLVAGFSIPYLELSMLYAACFLFFTINGAGLFSVDALLLGLFSSQPEGNLEQAIAPIEQPRKTLAKASK